MLGDESFETRLFIQKEALLRQALEKGRTVKCILPHRIIGAKCEFHLDPIEIRYNKDDMKYSQFQKRFSAERRDDMKNY